MTSARQPRVYWLIETFYPPIVGGAELLASFLCEGLAQRGLEVTVVTRQTIPHSPKTERVGNVNVERLAPAGILKGKGWKVLPLMVSYVLRLSVFLLVRARRYDAIAISGIKVMPLVVVPLCKLLGKTSVLRAESYFELHETISSESLRSMGNGPGRLFMSMLETVRRQVLRRADVIIAISSQIRAELHKIGIDPKRIVSLPNGVDLQKFKPVAAPERQALRRRLRLPEGDLVVYAGRLSRAKGVLMLVQVWQQLLATMQAPYLVIVGSGKLSFDDCEKDMKDFVQQNDLQERILFVGETDRVVDYLQAADLFVFPSDYEGFSLALAEALGCALPVVATSVGAAPELITQGANGFLCPPKDPPALLDALRRALNERERWPQIGAAARDSVAPYDLNRITDSYASLFAAAGRHGG